MKAGARNRGIGFVAQIYRCGNPRKNHQCQMMVKTLARIG